MRDERSAQPPWPSRVVLLRHDLPDGTSHYDLMVEVVPGGMLTTFRVGVRPDGPAVLEFDGERIGDHRVEYLDYEGAIGGARGTVQRVARGRCRVVHSGPDCLEIVADFGGGVRVLQGRRQHGDRWLFAVTAGG